MGILQNASALVRSCLLVLALAAGFPQAVLGQSAPTPAQMEMFRNLPPDQQKALLEAVGGRGDGTVRDPQLSTPVTSAPIEFATPEETLPRIAAGSTLLLTVAVVADPTANEAQRTLLNSRRERA